MIIEEKSLEGYEYISIKLNKNEDKEVLSDIKQKAEGDATKVNKRSPNGQIRDNNLIRYNNLGGVLAEEVVKIYLKNKAEEKRVLIEIYSSPFTGHFEHRDIKIKINGKIKTIEVRSSFQYKTTLQRVFTGAFSLIGNYTTSYKGEEPEKDFYIQVIHRYENPEIMNKIDEEVEALIIGGGTKNLFEEIGEKKFLKQEGAEYLVINPINKTKGVNFLGREILDLNDDKPLNKNKKEEKQLTL